MIRSDSRRMALKKLKEKLHKEKQMAVVIPLEKYDEKSAKSSQNFKRIFGKTRNFYAQNFGSRDILAEMRCKKEQKIEKTQAIAKRDRNEIWSLNDLAKLHFIEKAKLKEKLQKFVIPQNLNE